MTAVRDDVRFFLYTMLILAVSGTAMFVVPSVLIESDRMLTTVVAFSGTATAAGIALLLRYTFTPRQEQIFDENMKSTVDFVFDKIHETDIHKKSMYRILEGYAVDVQPCTSVSVIMSERDAEDLRGLSSQIYTVASGMESLTSIYPYVTIKQRTAVINYMKCSYWFMQPSSNVRGAFLVSGNTLLWHMLHAREIIEMFGRFTPPWFRERWTEAFSRFGGMGMIPKPLRMPGVLVPPADIPGSGAPFAAG